MDAKINPNIFKAYDIRGKYPSELNEETAEKIGRAAARFFARKYRRPKLKVLVCRDVRTSSQKLKEALSRGIIEQGSNILDAGRGTTPFFYFLAQKLKPDLSFMVTASHNPAEFNGFKIRSRGGQAVAWGFGLEKIKKEVMKSEIAPAKSVGTVAVLSGGRERYLNFLARGYSLGPSRTVIDAAGGSASLFLPELLNKFPEVVYKPIFFEPDGAFQKHSPNPLLPEAQVFIKKELEKGSFRFGAVFDGDGDRIVFFDQSGRQIKSEFVLGLFAEEELKKNPGAVFVMPINTSRSVREFIKESGGKVKLTRVGPAFLQAAMKKYRAPLGAEISGHFYFKEFFYENSGLMAWLRLAKILSRTHQPFSQLVKKFERYISTPSEINFRVKDAKKIMARIKKYYQERGVKVSRPDGILAEARDWWFNLRPSATEPVVRLVLEAKTREIFDEKLKEIEKLIKNG